MVKNLRINKDKISKKFKYRFLKFGVGAVVLATSLSMLFTGCTPNDNYYYVPESSVDAGISDYDVLNNPLIKIDNNNYNNSEMVVTESAYNSFMNYISNIKTIYNYESYYGVDEALSRYNQIANAKVTNHTHSISEITVDALVKKVKSNNAKYLEQKRKEYVAEFFEEFSDSEIKRIVTIVVDTINYYNNNGMIEDINEVKCILGDLKIFKKTILANAYVSDDNCLIVSPSMIETLEIKNLDGKQDVYKSTVGHEAIHLLQKGCIDNNLKFYSIGNSYEFKDLKVNPLFYNWFYEGAAEKLANTQMGYKPIVYEYYINYINSLELSVILNSGVNVNQIEQTTLRNSLEPLFELFGCKDYEDKKEVINMLFSLDVVETDTKDFLDAVNPNMEKDELVKIKRNLKASICETMTKYFYSNLATLVKEKNIPLNDVFYYITIFEADIDTHITYGKTEMYNDSIGFIEKYLDIQSNFFDYLASSNKYSKEEIESMFNDYGLKKTNGENNFSLSYLSSEKKKFLSKMLNTVYDNNTEQIRDVYARNTGFVTKK